MGEQTSNGLPVTVESGKIKRRAAAAQAVYSHQVAGASFQIMLTGCGPDKGQNLRIRTRQHA